MYTGGHSEESLANFTSRRPSGTRRTDDVKSKLSPEQRWLLTVVPARVVVHRDDPTIGVSGVHSGAGGEKAWLLVGFEAFVAMRGAVCLASATVRPGLDGDKETEVTLF